MLSAISRRKTSRVSEERRVVSGRSLLYFFSPVYVKLIDLMCGMCDICTLVAGVHTQCEMATSLLPHDIYNVVPNDPQFYTFVIS